MKSLANPFDSLIRGEELGDSKFVELFSPMIVPDTAALFKPGNIVLSGTQGSGKSMLLNLLKPETNIGYLNARRPFPPLEYGNEPFIGAGVNLTRSGAVDFLRRASADETHSPEVWQQLFGDFINYWICRDILRSVSLYQTVSMPGMPLQGKALDQFARLASADPCWMGGLKRVTSMQDLSRQLDDRILTYRHYLNFNRADLPGDVHSTKTSPGEPVSTVAGLLRETSAIGPDVGVLIRIDQYEALRAASEDHEGPPLATIIHRLLGSRDDKASYKVGTRRYAWPSMPSTGIGDGALENNRDYRKIDLDAILRKTESSKARFRRFASDVLDRRLRAVGVALPGKRPLVELFGSTPRPDERVFHYLGGRRSGATHSRGGDDAIQSSYAHVSPLDIYYERAWRLQKKRTDAEVSPAPSPWRERPYWVKERAQIALLQAAAENRQTLIYSGAADIEKLSDGNILAFLSICQHVWDAWLRGFESQVASQAPDLRGLRDPNVQNDGVYEASLQWYQNVRLEPGGDSRQQFLLRAGIGLRTDLREDRKMSYPGGNAFSLRPDDLRRNPDVKTFLEEAAAHGVLIDHPHTSKNRGEGKRVKWRLHNIYAPYFQLPMTFSKEPRYVDARLVREWMSEGRVMEVERMGASRETNLRRSFEQGSLFDE
ncbi:hypothetical protein [Ornithinimicrobium cerasi]|uniref:Uncharacterized protein n=1 Tax=Ornithinimicrobium cerasi TaxID=2248773 RepID=A0A285VWM9_9MICO|nr:hypothetical protein [Ornithinimicrobium cerasi]SOC58363.1 hypothetical protein SAMN05421879_1317 [Ornithinimicrobium cerasi]